MFISKNNHSKKKTKRKKKEKTLTKSFPQKAIRDKRSIIFVFK